MKQNKHKTRDEWEKLLLDLSPEEFEELCYYLLQSNQFQNLNPRGKGGDGGRDIEGELIQKIARETITQKVWFQCKRYGNKTPLNYRTFAPEVQKAQNANVDRYVVMSNKDMTSDTKDEIKKWNASNKCQISDWTGTIFIGMLWECPNVCKTYFPDQEVPLLVDKSNPKTLIQQSSNLGERFDVKITLHVGKGVDINNPHQVADIFKDCLLNLINVDVNIKALIYEKASMFFFSIERVDDALMFLDKSLEITPKNEIALLNKGYILEKTDKIDDSTECYDELLDINPENKFALNNKANNLRRKGELDEALKIVEESLKVDPRLIVAIQTKTEILKTLNRSDEAVRFLDSQTYALKKSSLLKELKVRLYINLIDLKKAYSLNKQILEQNPDDINAINNQGVIYENNFRYKPQEKYLRLALEWFEKAIHKNKDFSLGWSNKTVALLIAGQIKQAENIIDIAYGFFPKEPYILHKKGLVFLEKNDPKNALKYFDRALKLRYEEEFLINKAQAYVRLSKWREAVKDADYVIKNNEKSSDAWFIKAQAIRRLHQPERAKLFEEKAKKFEKKPRSLLEE